ncbi:ribbon-helix-helix domain-containing protein [Demequina sp. TMPB413]|uniref:ribbon-helix-helix domain-containing protein n=1 Tax=Demequina sp. TMPB413 TaxID=2881056 RepID=UPI00200ADA48|nr:ribbon-helix-helix domain-containing protein [Demequina sp. TMPB413]UPU88594.1 ribbon-helix-helix domain-containing protein [Demequina sp. TMPB413]
MKLSISLTDDDVALIDQFAAAGDYPSRSAVIQHALARLRAQGLHGDYADAWTEFSDGGDAGRWEASS